MTSMRSGCFVVFVIVKARDHIRVPPAKFNKPLEEAVLEELREKYEGALVSMEHDGRALIGIVTAILNADVDPVGLVIPGDGASYHKVSLEALVFAPFEREVVEGEVVSVTRAGLYVNLSVLDGFVHINQVADERVVFDPARGSLLLEESRRYVDKGDVVRARVYVTGILPGKGLRMHMTMRQPGLGKLEWIRKRER